MKKAALIHFPKSLKKRSLIYTTVIFSIILALTFFSGSYSLSQLRDQAVRYNTEALSLHLNALDTHMNHTSSFLMNFLIEESNYNGLTDPNMKSDTEVSILQALQRQISFRADTNGLFFYSPESDTLLMHSNRMESYYDRLDLKTYLRDTYQDASLTYTQPYIQRWVPMELNGHTFLMETVSYHNIYIGSWYDAAYLLSSLNSMEDSTEGLLFLSNRTDDTRLFPKDAAFSLPLREHLEKNYIAVTSASSTNDYKLWLYMSKSAVLGELSYFNIFVFIMLFLISMLLLLHFSFLWKNILRPVTTLISGMKMLRQGDFDQKLPVLDTQDEFAEMSKTFNYMTEEIQNLKIQIYEDKIEKVNMELDYLTLQIKPHFFQNCLNIIYSLSMVHKTELITEMTTYLMKYFRYLFKDSNSLVLISEELDHVNSYLHIHELRYGSQFQMEVNVSPELSNCSIPVLSIQTFTENIFKHAYSSGETIAVSITVLKKQIKEQDYISIVIRDNGIGFSEEQLEMLNCLPDTSLPGRHIGIENVCHRLKYIYGELVHILFSNSKTGGAVVELQIPLNF